jgi:hypothetical protein
MQTFNCTRLMKAPVSGVTLKVMQAKATFGRRLLAALLAALAAPNA